ncbi:DUF4336 domain-containing protein [Filomicrobium sp.]|uniref:DUF4336 domain-containing protein n=1 Tax=Filomicrobium sp. TaxID=2024831 RepID=UPI0025876550|nr:DUF4336 domain-containing protein [Filomicrobium sp.]MCV0370472.1 DUF4336 domain-containing protein [Filomicrobium sp.]
MAVEQYAPLNTLKPVADDVWIVDGPLIRFGMPMFKMPFPTRMSIVRLAGGDLFVHSPTPLTRDLKAEVEALGCPRWIIGPNRIHYWWIPEWRDAFADADVYLAPRIKEQAGDRIDFAALPLEAEHGYPWDEAIDTLPVVGDFMTEVEFFHRASRTLILTDFIENFEPQKLGLVMRMLTWVGGVQDPDGQMPRDMRLTFVRQKLQLRAAIETMISWDPERVIIAHGRWYPANGAAELRRAFRWILN